MSELLREIQEDIRAERMQKLWHNFGKTMVRVSVAILIGTIGAVVWKNHKESQATEQTAQLMKGIDRLNIEDYKGAIETFDAIESNPYARMAMLQKANAQLALGDKEGMRKTYESLAAQDDGDAFVILSRLLLAEDEKEPLTVHEDTPFHHVQMEIRAWQLLEGGNKSEAVELFTALRDDEKTPFSLRSRVAEALAYLEPMPEKDAKAPAND